MKEGERGRRAKVGVESREEAEGVEGGRAEVGGESEERAGREDGSGTKMPGVEWEREGFSLRRRFWKVVQDWQREGYLHKSQLSLDVGNLRPFAVVFKKIVEVKNDLQFNVSCSCHSL